MNWFDLTLKLKGFPIEKAKKKLINIQEEFHNNPLFNEVRKIDIVNYHLENNLFYRNLVKTFTTWENLPILTKKDLQQPLANRLSNGYYLKNVYVNKTSGSSGDPFIFAIDKAAHALTWANYIYLFGQYGIDFNSSLQARFYGIPLDFFGNKKERLKDFLSKRYRFNVFNLNDKVLEKYLKKFTSKKFIYINGYTSSIVLFADFLRRKNIILKNICPSLTSCFVTSEMLHDDDRYLLENQIGVPIINEYGASETGIIAFENIKNQWIINQETLFVEVVDENNKALPFGQEGKILITSLYNKAHPFIRYEIGDSGIINKIDHTLILEKLTGRKSDIAILSNGKVVPGLTFYYVTKSIIKDNNDVKEFVVKQSNPNLFIVEYVSNYELTNNQKLKIKEAFSVYVSDGLDVNFEKKTIIKRSKSGKLKQFEKLF